MSELISDELQIRKATPNDLKTIHQFIVGLAKYEGFEDQVECTVELLHEQFFGVNPCAHVIIGECEEKPAGMAIYYYNFSTYKGTRGIYLEDLYINPDFRGRSFGTQLLSKLAQIADEEGCERMEWCVLDENESAIRFYENLDARPKNERITYRIQGEAMERLAEIESEAALS